MGFKDLRAFLKRLEQEGDLMKVEGVDWDLELGTITELMAEKHGPALLFDKVKGYPPGFRVATHLYEQKRRFAMASGLPATATSMELINRWRSLQKEGFTPVKPTDVRTGPIMENVHVGEDANILEFPVPKYHEHDSGRYAAAGAVAITRDPDTGYVNAGVQRAMVHDEKTLGQYLVTGKHNQVIRNKYHAKGLSCPIAYALGPDPMLYASATLHLPWGVSELDWAGWMKGEPIEVIKGPITGLPLPANDEIVIEGEIPPPEVEVRPEGPFGEWPGYYSGQRNEPVLRIKAIYHRDNPILFGAPPLKPPILSFGIGFTGIPAIWDNLQSAGVTNVMGVGQLEAGGDRLITVVSIKQDHAGHAMQAGMVAAGGHGAAYMVRFVIVVDEDIDPTDTNEVLWAIATRCDPETSIQVIKGCWGSRVDPILSPEMRERGDFSHSIAIINACRPFYWKDRFPLVNKASSELRRRTLDKWEGLFEGLSG